MKTDIWVLVATCAVAIVFPRLGVALDTERGGYDLVREIPLSAEWGAQPGAQPPVQSGTLEPAHWLALQVPPTDGLTNRTDVVLDSGNLVRLNRADAPNVLNESVADRSDWSATEPQPERSAEPIVRQEASFVLLAATALVLLGNADVDALVEASMRRRRSEQMMKSLIWILPIGLLGFVWYLVRRTRKPDW